MGGRPNLSGQLLEVGGGFNNCILGARVNQYQLDAGDDF